MTVVPCIAESWKGAPMRPIGNSSSARARSGVMDSPLRLMTSSSPGPTRLTRRSRLHSSGSTTPSRVFRMSLAVKMYP
jgi:hypothetical protein